MDTCGTPNQFGDKFGGVIVINLAIAEVFEPFYSSLALGSSSSITLRSKTKLLSRYPAASATFDIRDSILPPLPG